MSDTGPEASGDRLPDHDEIAHALHSRDPDRVATALELLDRAWRRRPVVPMPMPDAHALSAAFPHGVPDDVVERFIRVLENYPAFEPPPDPGERHTEALDAARLVGPGQATYDVALAIRVDPDAPHAVKVTMRHLLRDPARSASELAVVDQLLDHLLDSDTTHRAVVEGLVDWASLGDYDELVRSLSGRLDETERASIDAARDD